MQIRWRLRHVAAAREIWTGAELRRRLAKEAGLELGTSAISDLMSKQPSEVKLTTLAALCEVLRCTPSDLLELVQDQDEVPPERE
ncbi:XRE family transcriptional regulator [Kibdelosporangium aridum]|uniref:XRE family transcriptional regulator n=1 Tax=Kibdelosporangium aridum TaxID=2030 RepID=A0A428YC28_KIBAR|nr:XRE family transcriptional regulator [Kibdelosporangium aridum]